MSNFKFTKEDNESVEWCEKSYPRLTEEYKKIMLANSSDEYFFETIDPPIVAEKKSSPARSIICIFFLYN